MARFSISRKEITLLNYKNITEVYLFGSVARGDQDNLSDLDLLIVVEDCVEEAFSNLKSQIAAEIGINPSWLSLYRRKSIYDLYEYGSHFLWHIKLEGEKIYSKNNELEELLHTLPQNQRTKKDLQEYYEICEDICVSVEADNRTLLYELNLLASLARNTCIILSAMNGEYQFGRMSAVQYAIRVLKEPLPFTLEEYKELYKFRIISVRGIELVYDKPAVDYVNQWVDKIKLLIDLVMECKEGREHE